MNRYLMIGAGGTGSHLLPALIHYLETFHREDEYLLGVMDGDSVEPHNLERQLFHTAAVNLPKADAVLLPYKNLKNVLSIKHYLGSENIAEYIKEETVVLICVDNFPVRALIESHCNTLQNVVVINGGNERHSGTCQIWIRENGHNVTPPLSFEHPEIFAGGANRAEMSCQEIANLPGGEQLIVTNMMSAVYMLNALMAFNEGRVDKTEWEFNFLDPRGNIATDYRVLDGWRN